MKPYETLSPRQKILRWTVRILLALVMLLLAVLLFVFLGARSQPKFYREAIAVPAETLKPKSDAAIRKITNFYNETQTPGSDWTLRISEDEINGWLAVDLPQNNAELLPPGMKKPRVSINPNSIEIACLYEQGPANGVLYMNAGAFMRSPNELALRLRGVNIGVIPFPKQKALKLFRQALEASGQKVQESNEGGDPVLIIQMNPKTKKGDVILLDTVKLDDGGLLFTGTTGKK